MLVSFVIRIFKIFVLIIGQWFKVIPLLGGTPVDGTRTVFKEEELEKENILVMETDTINKRNVNLAKLLSMYFKPMCFIDFDILFLFFLYGFIFFLQNFWRNVNYDVLQKKKSA